MYSGRNIPSLSAFTYKYSKYGLKTPQQSPSPPVCLADHAARLCLGLGDLAWGDVWLRYWGNLLLCS